MASAVDVPTDRDAEQKERDDPRTVLERSLVTGMAIALPLLVTLVVLGFVLNFVLNTLNPAVGLVRFVTGTTNPPPLLVETVTILLFVLGIFVLGFVSEYHPSGQQIGSQLDEFMESIPGLGSVYRSFNEMAELIVDSDTESFRDVKLVEYPTAGSYVLAFKTAETPDVIAAETGHEKMETLFMPMAPNPVMGGFVIHVSTDRVIDVDLTVEQGIQSIVTSGVVMGEEAPRLRGLTRRRMRDLAGGERVRRPASRTDAHRPRPGRRGERREAYEAGVDPEHAETAEKIADRTHRHESEQ